MELFKWIKGRQLGTDYHKWCFLYWKIGRYGFDGYILRYEAHTSLPLHKDPVNGSHYRLNIKLKGASNFICGSCIYRWDNKVILFRPDLFLHSLLVLTKTYKLSLGFVKFNK